MFEKATTTKSGNVRKLTVTKFGKVLRTTEIRPAGMRGWEVRYDGGQWEQVDEMEGAAIQRGWFKFER